MKDVLLLYIGTKKDPIPHGSIVPFSLQGNASRVISKIATPLQYHDHNARRIELLGSLFTIYNFISMHCSLSSVYTAIIYIFILSFNIQQFMNNFEYTCKFN